MTVRAPLNDAVACLRRNWPRWLVAVTVTAVVIAGYLMVIDSRIEDRREFRVELCVKVNELPSKIARALMLSERRRHIIGPTTTLPPADLTPEEQAELNRIIAEMAEVVTDLGRPVKGCDITGTTATTTRR